MTDGNVVEPNVLYKYGNFNEHTEKIFTRPENQLTEDYITGKLGWGE